MSNVVRRLKKPGRLPGFGKGLFKKFAPKLRHAKTLPRPPAIARTPRGSVMRQPRYIPAKASPYRPEIAAMVPERKKKKTDGVIDIGGERVIAQSSTYDGPNVDGTVKAGRNLNSHVEMHAVAAMRKTGQKEATVYINNPKGPCSYTSGGHGGHPDGCSVWLSKPGKLLPGEKVTVYYPPGRVKVYTGD